MMNMKLDVFAVNGSVVGDIKLSDAVFNVEKNEQVVYDIVRWHRANKRQGTQQTKGSGDVAGSTKKIRAQKETGKSRQGDGREGHFRGGGHIFEIRPRSYDFKLNKKVRKLALKMCLSSKVMDKAFFVVDGLSSYSSYKTVELASILDSVTQSVGFKKILLIVDSVSDHVMKSSQGIKNLMVLPQHAVNSLALIWSDLVVVSKSSVDLLEGRLA